MALSKKQINRIKKAHSQKSAGQIAAEEGLRESQVLQALGNSQALWALRLEMLTGTVLCGLVLVSPFVFLSGLSNYADLPQRAFIQAAAACLLVLWLLKAAVQAEIEMPKGPVCFAAAAFVIWSFASLLWSQDPYEGFAAAVHWGACGLVFFAVGPVLCRREWIEKILLCLLAALCGVVLLGLAQHYFELNWVPHRKASAAFGNANMAAHYVAILLPLIVMVGIYRRRSFFGAVAGITCVLSLVYLLHTGCRASWLGLGVAAVWVGVALGMKGVVQKLNRKVFVAVTVAAVVLASMSTGLIRDDDLPRIMNKLGSSAVYRLVVWKNCLEMIKEKPLLGFGAGGFKQFYSGYIYKGVVDTTFSKEKQIRRAHNDYLQFAVDLGVPGGLILCFLPVCGLALALWVLKRSRSSAVTFTAVGLSASLGSFMTAAYFSFPMQRALPPLLLCLYLSMLVALGGRAEKSPGTVRVRVPRWAAIFAAAVMLVSGGSLARYNWDNVNCDRYFRMAMGMEKRRANRRALDAALKAHACNRQRMDVLTTVGRAYVTTGQLAEGISALKTVVERQPYNLNALFILGSAYANSDNNEQALEVFRRVLRIKPDFDDAKKIIANIKSRGKVRINLT